MTTPRAADIPEVRIQFARLLYNGLSKDIAELYDMKFPLVQGKRELPSIDWCNDQVEQYRKEWNKYSDQILQSMQTLHGLSFYNRTIDAYVAPFMRSQSTPLLFGTKEQPDEFVDELTHELVHVLLSDNAEGLSLGPALFELYSNHAPLVRIHILVHASMKYIFLDVLHEESRLTRNIRRCSNNVPYREAWEVVEKEGYQNILSRVKSFSDNR